VAVLRRHPEPLEHGLLEFAKFCDQNGFPFDATSAAGIQASLSDESLEAMHPHAKILLTHKLTNPMQSAEYFCTGDYPSEAWAHYALAVAHYTHFTSPIRRYPDILVHRLLQKALDVEAAGERPDLVQQTRIEAMDQVEELRQLQELLDGTNASHDLKYLEREATQKRQKELASVCAHCNDRKASAKKAQEASDKVFLAIMLRHHPVITDVIVLSGGPQFLGLLSPQFGIEVKAYVNDIDQDLLESSEWDGRSKALRVKFKDGQHLEIENLATVRVRMFTVPEKVPLEVRAQIVPPNAT